MLKHLCFFNVSWSFLYIINTGWYEFCLLFTKSSICVQIDSPSIYLIIQLIQSPSLVWLFVTPWTAACQASLFITNSRSLCKLMSIESVMPCNFLILCRPLLPPSIFNLIISFHYSSASTIIHLFFHIFMSHHSWNSKFSILYFWESLHLLH